MSCTPNVRESNFTGLRYAEEACLGVLPGETDDLQGEQPGVPTWYELEPNSYGDFGGELTTVARTPIKAGRQREKGVVTDMDANAAFQIDMTLDNLYRLSPGFFFANWRANNVALVVNGVDGSTEDFDAEGEFPTALWPVGTLVFAEGFATEANNGLHVVDSANEDSLGVSSNLTTEAGVAQTIENFTFTLTIEADMDNGYAEDVVVSYTASDGDTIDTVGDALVALLAAHDPVVTASYTAGTDVLQIDAGENAGDSTITFEVTRDGVSYDSMDATIEAPTGMANDTRDIDLTASGVAPTVIVGAKVWRVGFQGASGDLRIDASTPNAPRLTTQGGTDFTTWGLNEGQWMFIGGDLTAEAFATAGNNGFARIAKNGIAAGAVTFDKTQNTMATDTGTGKTIRVFHGPFIHNEADPDNIVRRSYQFERSLAGAGYEYVIGSVPNNLTLNIATADKLTVDLEFVATNTLDVEAVDRKPGDRPALDTNAQAFNTSSDFSRIRLSRGTFLATPLFAFVTDMTLSINNNVSPVKAVGYLGAIDASAGDFVVEGNVTAYFSNVESAQAVRNNDTVTMDFATVAGNKGWVWDIPGITLGDGKKNVEKDQPITIPLSMAAFRDAELDYTLGACFFPYLPDRAG